MIVKDYAMNLLKSYNLHVNYEFLIKMNQITIFFLYFLFVYKHKHKHNRPI